MVYGPGRRFRTVGISCRRRPEPRGFRRATAYDPGVRVFQRTAAHAGARTRHARAARPRGVGLERAVQTDL